MKDMAKREALRYLTESLREVAGHHLHPTEDVLTSIYIEQNAYLVREQGVWFMGLRRVQLPTRAFILTPERAMLLDDPTDSASTTADREYLFASCSLNTVLHFELCSHLLNCALTLVCATPHGPERIIIEYNGVARNHFLAAVAYIRARVDHQMPPSSAQADEVYTRERAVAMEGWYATLLELSMTQQNNVTCGLVPGEHIQEWVNVPAIDERTWWQRLGIGAYEQPAAMLVRTDRQILLIKETKRVIRGHGTYGSDTWIMPLKHLRMSALISEQEKLYLQITLEHQGATESVRLPVLPELAERALALVSAPLSMQNV